MKTANIATLDTLNRKATQGQFLFLKYLPHLTIAVVLLALLLVASRTAPSPQAAHPENHMGQRL